MSKIHITILLVLLMAVTAIGGYLVLVVEKTPDPRFIPAVAFIPTTKIDPGSKVNALRGKVPNYNFNKRKKKSADQPYPAPENEKSSLHSLAGAVRSVNSTPAVAATYSYSKHSPKSNQAEPGSSMQGMGALGLLASGNKKSSGGTNIGGSSSSIPSSLASTSYDKGLTPGSQFAPDATDGINEEGNPGGDPDTPVGDGVVVLLLLAIGYLGWKRTGPPQPLKGGSPSKSPRRGDFKKMRTRIYLS